MGMDVYGKESTDSVGDYFRNNVWWWHPLWGYCCEVAPKLIDAELAKAGHFNDGEGLNTQGSITLADLLEEEIRSGRTQAYANAYTAKLEALPSEQCNLCAGTGVRDDAVGVTDGMPERELDAEVAKEVGRGRGWCNGCEARGTKRPFDTYYPFSTENVEKFAKFLRTCGGFGIS